MPHITQLLELIVLVGIYDENTTHTRHFRGGIFSCSSLFIAFGVTKTKVPLKLGYINRARCIDPFLLKLQFTVDKSIEKKWKD